MIHALITIVGYSTLGVAALYAFLSVIAVIVWRFPKRARLSQTLPPVTVLKPLCGAEPGLYEDLRSFCIQDYPEYQLIFGMRDQSDPARSVAERLQAEFPELPIRIVINPQLHGHNCKISNLINMLQFAEHGVLTMADSDGSVDPGYLKCVTAPLLDPGVGLVTCIYRGLPTQGIWSRLGAMYINEWYVPSVLLAWLFGHQGYVSGQTICLRRDTLEAIGGLSEITNHLADDYRLGELVRNAGQRIVLSPYVVTGKHHEPSLDSVTRHELRWMRTLAVLRPLSFRGLFLTFSLPLTVLGVALLSNQSPLPPLVQALVTVAVSSRLTLHFLHRWGGERRMLSDLWLLPVRDILICWVWMRSFFTSRVVWRGNEFDIDPDGIMRRL